MIKKATENDIPTIEKLLKIENGNFKNLDMPKDIFIMRLRTFYKAFGLDTPNICFYLVEKPNCAPDGLLCVHGASALYTGAMQDLQEFESFLNALKIISFKSNNMLLPNWLAKPHYLMKRDKTCKIGVHVAPVMDKPDLWQLSQSGTLSNISAEAWYSSASRLVKANLADIRAVALNVNNSAQYVSTVGIYSMNDYLAYISAVETKEEHRGCGYASTLISVLANAHADKDIYLTCTPEIHGFYERLGFNFAMPVCEFVCDENA